MVSTTAIEVRKVDRAVTALIDEWTVRTKRRHAVGDSLDRLGRLAAEQEHVRPLAARLLELAEWLDRYGEVVVGAGVTRHDLDQLVASAEMLVELRESSEGIARNDREQLGALVDRLVGVIRKGTGRLGLEYTPAGLVDAQDRDRGESERVRQSLLEKLHGFEDIKAVFRQSLSFQNERLDYFYQEDTHLLTVLDYQLKNLEARPNPDDELFAASLLYFLGLHNYQIKPYLRRFQKVATRSDGMKLWEEPSA